MLQGLFNYDNPVWRFIGKLGDLIILNVLWLITSIPIVTIGASTTALYYVTLKLVRDEDGYTIRSFFKSFKENFKQSTIIWLIMLAVGLLIGFDLYFFIYMQTDPSKLRSIMVAVFGSLGLVYLCILTYVFPLQSRFYNQIKRTLFTAFFMSIRHILQTLGILVMDIALGVLMFVTFFSAPQFSVLFFLFGFPLVAFVNSFVFHAIFKKYIPKNDREDDKEHRPLFADEDNGKEQ